MTKIKTCPAWGPITKGAEVGLEVEVEANQPLDDLTEVPLWIRTTDNSLRGNYNAEYVLKHPLSLDDALVEIDTLRTYLSKRDVDETIRAGIHVHVNVRDLTYTELLNFFALYYALEQPLTEYCGKNRVGNHFCLRVQDAEAVLPAIVDFFKSDGDTIYFENDQYRYAAMNVVSFPKYGSIEFRAMQTYPNLERFEEWVKVLVHLKNAACNIGEPLSIIENISGQGPTEWAKDVLGEHFKLIEKQTMLDSKIITGMRYAQDLIMFTGK